MREIASRGQLRLAFLRWAIVTVPFILLLGFTSARFAPTGAQNPWYAALAKPAGMPAEWAFPVAWSVLYVLLGLALAMVINARGSRFRAPAIVAFAVQMVANLIWAPLFFGAHQVTGAMIVVGVLFVLVLVTTLLFGRVRAGAAWLMVPYLAWIVYAGLLLYQIDRLNPDASGLVSSRTTDQIEIK